MHLDDFNNIESLGVFILFFFFPSFLVLKRAHEFSKHQPVSDSTVCDSIILLQLFPVSLAFQAFFIFCWPNLIWKLSKCAIDIFWNQHHSCLFIEQAITSSKVDKQKQKDVRQRCRERETIDAQPEPSYRNVNYFVGNRFENCAIWDARKRYFISQSQGHSSNAHEHNVV